MEKREQITISPTTRIEGHGKVTIFLDEFGNVSDAHFQATEIRGFEQFLKGMDANRLPFIISRMCGVCSTAHIIASVKAIEDAFQIKVPETAEKIRELLLMAQIISNHSLVFFFLTLPDFYFGHGEDPSMRNVFEILRRDPEMGKKGMELRLFGTRLYSLVGGREVHIVSTIPGGQIKPINEELRRELLSHAEKTLTIAREALTLGKKLFLERGEEDQFSDVKTNYMGVTKDGVMNFQDGQMKVVDSLGKIIYEFPFNEYRANLEEKALPWTYAKFAYLKKLGWPEGIIKVGPTSRMNVIDYISTPLASEALKEFRERFGRPTHRTLVFDYARLIELLYACERTAELLEDENITGKDIRVKVTPKEGRGVGIVEAPRGTLIHDYQFDGEGKCKDLHLIIPTQINNAAINISVKNEAFELIRFNIIKPGLLNRVEMVIRAYDPCIKCATRNQNGGVKVEIRDFEGNFVREL